ncbi:hypothetical protein RND81_13G164500 [Saponaria officinalis]|uniref:E3 ubiquitin-protein ligase RMA n=1 Tax=Saponaria officinalis TaxID=3572 RepID=A0AAW1H4H8_SAPOF
MGTGFEESTRKTVDETFAASSSDGGSNNNNNEAGDFECNICFDLAQDPIVTLCGHLFCWPCLYRWLHYHSQSQECPVCKAIVQENKLVPLYGRGKSTSDPRTRPIPGFEVPNRPAGQRPETAPPMAAREQRYLPNFGNFGFGLLGGFMPMTTARFGNITMSAGLGGLFPGMMSFQFGGFPDSSMYGAGHPHGFQNAFPHTVHGHGMHHGHGFQNHPQGSSQRQDVLLKNLLVIIGFLVLLSFIFT